MEEKEIHGISHGNATGLQRGLNGTMKGSEWEKSDAEALSTQRLRRDADSWAESPLRRAGDAKTMRKCSRKHFYCQGNCACGIVRMG